MTFEKIIEIEVDLSDEVEFDECSGEADRVIHWIDGRGYDITNAPEIVDSHGKTVWENEHVKRLRRNPQVVVARPPVVEGHD